MSDFVDVATIKVRAGRGGDGLVSWRREKFVPRGGPGGGDGGKGGDVILRVDPHMRTLLDFTYRAQFHAPDGQPGGSSNKTGGGGEDLIIRVPPGTVVFDTATGQQVADLLGPGYELGAARGGRGGRGNTRFATASRQAPYFAEKGEPAQEYSLRLEMKLLADVGLLGLPSVGKSTLIARISAARPKIAAYHFTTLSPNLGVVVMSEDRQMVVADLPGLIEGAHQGVGLGHQFLRHAERSRVLVHLLDASGSEGRDPLQDFAIINHELAQYGERLASAPQIVALNKIDLSDGRDYAPMYGEELARQGYQWVGISAVSAEGVPELLEMVWAKLQEMGGPLTYSAEPAEAVRIEMPAEPRRELRVERLEPRLFLVSGTAVESFMARADLGREQGVREAQLRLDRMGVIERLEDLGAVAGDTVLVGDLELEYRPDYL
jgi:GTP-binding protein